MKTIKTYLNILYDKLIHGLKTSWTMRGAILILLLQMFDAAWPVIPLEFKTGAYGIALTAIFAFLRMRSL